MTSPLVAVLEAASRDATTRDDIAAATGLPRMLVDAALDYLTATGEFTRRVEKASCAGSCSRCHEKDSCGSADTTSRGLVTLTLTPTCTPR